MEYGAIDLHNHESQIRIVKEDGEIVDQRIATTRDHFTALFWGRPRMRILLEASTESEWVAQHLESFGHEVDRRGSQFYADVQSAQSPDQDDRRDVAALAEACRRGYYRAAHRRSAAQRTVQCQLNIRRELTDTRTRAISLARAMTRGAGLRIRSGSTGSFLTRLSALDLPSSIATTLSPLRNLITVLNEELTQADATFAKLVADDPVVTHLTTLPDIGPITASAYVAALDDASRFGRAAQVTSYLGSGAGGVQLGRAATARARGAQCASTGPSLARASRVADVAIERPSDRRAPRLGAGYCPASREADCDGGVGAPHRSHPVRDVARPGGV
jgi:transposase